MELKLGDFISGLSSSLGFNRTFMELKLQRDAHPDGKICRVLIGPSWN